MYQLVIAHYARSFPARTRNWVVSRNSRRGYRFFIIVKIFAAAEPAAFTRARGIWQETWNVLQHARSENLGRWRARRNVRDR